MRESIISQPDNPSETTRMFLPISSVLIFCIGAFLYALMNYGGIRAPDSEIVFRVGESLESNLTFEVANDLESWKGFGVASG